MSLVSTPSAFSGTSRSNTNMNSLPGTSSSTGATSTRCECFCAGSRLSIPLVTANEAPRSRSSLSHSLVGRGSEFAEPDHNAQQGREVMGRSLMHPCFIPLQEPTTASPVTQPCSWPMLTFLLVAAEPLALGSATKTPWHWRLHLCTNSYGLSNLQLHPAPWTASNQHHFPHCQTDLSFPFQTTFLPLFQIPHQTFQLPLPYGASCTCKVPLSPLEQHLSAFPWSLGTANAAACQSHLAIVAS